MITQNNKAVRVIFSGGEENDRTDRTEHCSEQKPTDRLTHILASVKKSFDRAFTCFTEENIKNTVSEVLSKQQNLINQE